MIIERKCGLRKIEIIENCVPNTEIKRAQNKK